MRTDAEIEQAIEEAYSFGAAQAEEQAARERMLAQRDARQFHPLTYLSSPYSHSDGAIVLRRYEINIHATAWLIRKYKWNVFSPIVHSHPLGVIAGIQGDWDFWCSIDRDYLRVSERIVILRLPGWEQSVGVNAERAIAAEFRLQLAFLDALPDNEFELHEQ